MSDFKTEMH